MDDLIFKTIDKDLKEIINGCLAGKELVVSKFGNAKINKYGYYTITSCKEGNHGKLLHRLIWEDYHGKPVPEGYDIHHINGNKLDNRIQNLQYVEHGKHMRFHKKGENNPCYGRTGKNNPMYRIKRPEHSERMTGENNPQAKYNLWDITSVHYIKSNMFRDNPKLNPRKCFIYKYNAYRLPIGGFHDFVSVEIINDLVNDAIGDGDG